MSNYGSKEHVDARKNAAKTEKEFVGAGQKPGLEIWRVENRRTKSDTPDFGIKRWPKEDYGSFYSGDSYLVLNTYKVKVDGKETDKLGWDVHFWLGKESSQDEIGVAAYKAVELDDLLDDGPVQHRETQSNESALFQSYFKGIQYMEGGIASGFRAVKPEEYKPRLFQVRRTRKAVRAFEVPVKASSLNHGDVFILDAGLKVFMFIGEHSNAFEKMKGGAVASGIVSARQGKAKFFPEVNDDFWKILGGSAKDVQVAKEDVEEDETDRPIDADKVKLFRLSDATGKMTFSKEAEGKISEEQLDTNDVFIVDCDIEIFVWVGKGASKQEKSQCMKTAMEYLKKQGKPSTIPVTRIMQGQIHHVFGGVVAPKKSSSVIQRATSGTQRVTSVPRPAPGAVPAEKKEPATTYSTGTLKSSGKKLW
jgi:gelsolin